MRSDAKCRNYKRKKSKATGETRHSMRAGFARLRPDAKNTVTEGDNENEAKNTVTEGRTGKYKTPQMAIRSQGHPGKRKSAQQVVSSLVFCCLYVCICMFAQILSQEATESGKDDETGDGVPTQDGETEVTPEDGDTEDASEQGGEDAQEPNAPTTVNLGSYMHLCLAIHKITFVHPTQHHTRILFQSCHTHALLMGVKVLTSRIGWCAATVARHRGCMDRGELVKCTLGYGYDSTLGWLLYEKIWTQTVGQLTLEQVKMEGREGMSVEDFQRKFLGLDRVSKTKPRVLKCTDMTCLQFAFFPMIGAGRRDPG